MICLASVQINFLLQKSFPTTQANVKTASILLLIFLLSFETAMSFYSAFRPCSLFFFIASSFDH